MAPVPVLYVMVRTSSIREVYGGEKSTMATAEALPAEGFSARFLLSGRDDLAGELAGRGLPFEALDVYDPFEGLRGASWLGRAKRILGILRLNATVLREIRSHGVQIVHTNAIPGFFVAWLGARLGRAKLIYHVRGASRARRARWFEHVAVLLADRTLTVSSSLRDQLLHTERTWLAPLLEGRVQPVVTGFDFARVDAALREPRDQARAATGPAPDRLSALMVGGIYHDKGQLPFVERVLPRLVAEVPSIHVTFIGGVKDPAYVSRLKDVLRRTGTESHTSFPGYLPIADVYRWYRGADLLLLPSEREGLPRAAIEAQAFALPVVATRIVGSLEVVADGQTGFLIDPDRLEDMIPAIRRLSDPALRQNMGAAGSRLVRDRYSLERNVREIGDIYRELLSGS